METRMKKLILCAFTFTLLGGALYAQEEASLETFDKCNNWARQYCQAGAHEDAVNAELLRLKNAGIPITLERIKMLSQKIKPATLNQPEQE